MEVLFLGTGAGIPSKTRNVSSLALRLHDEINETWLFDCGEGTQHQILKTNIRPKKISNIFITHMHGDHIFGLPGLLSSRSFQGGDGPINIYGPPSIEKFIQMNLALSKSNLLYEINIHELNPQGGQIKTTSGWRVDYLPLNHGILSFGFRIKEADKAGELLVDQLLAYNIPNGPIYGQLKQGKTVTLEDGQVLNGKDFIGPERKGRIITILGDTRPCKNAYLLSKKANLLVHEATHGGDEAKMANQYFHSTNIQAAELAKEAQVKKLALNHISARYLKEDIHKLQEEAQSVFENSIIVNDFTTITIE